MILNEVVDWSIEIRKALIVAAPVVVVTWFIWYLTGISVKKRERVKIAARLSAMCRKYTLLQHENEKSKIEFQMVRIKVISSTTEIERQKSLELLKDSRDDNDKWKLLRLETSTEITELNVQLVIYAKKHQKIELNRRINDVGKYQVRTFEDDFKDITDPNKAISKKIELISNLDKNFFNEGYSKEYEDIRRYLEKEFINKKCTAFKCIYCYNCCCCDY